MRATVEPIPGGLRVVDENGRAIAYLYGRETAVAARQAGVPTLAEAERFAHIFARAINEATDL